MAGDARFYASPEDDGFCLMQADNARDAAIEYANENAMEPSDLVYVVYATEVGAPPDGWGNPEEECPLDIHARWCFRLVAEVPGGFEVEVVTDAR